jgi:hypothetical protein
MDCVPLITACMPHAPLNAEFIDALKRPLPVVADDQAPKPPDSKLSEKIASDGMDVDVGGSDVLVAVGVKVGGGGVGVLVAAGGSGVLVAVDVAVGGSDVLVAVGVAVGGSGVLVAVGGRGVLVAVGVAVGGNGVLVTVGVEVGGSGVLVATGVGVGKFPLRMALYAAITSMRPAPKVLSAPAVPRSRAELIKADRS